MSPWHANCPGNKAISRRGKSISAFAFSYFRTLFFSRRDVKPGLIHTKKDTLRIYRNSQRGNFREKYKKTCKKWCVSKNAKVPVWSGRYRGEDFWQTNMHKLKRGKTKKKERASKALSTVLDFKGLPSLYCLSWREHKKDRYSALPSPTAFIPTLAADQRGGRRKKKTPRRPLSVQRLEHRGRASLSLSKRAAGALPLWFTG